MKSLIKKFLHCKSEAGEVYEPVKKYKRSQKRNPPWYSGCASSPTSGEVVASVSGYEIIIRKSSGLLAAGDLQVFSGNTNPTATAGGGGGNLPNHTVSLISSTYGVLNFSPFQKQNPECKSLSISRTPRSRRTAVTDPNRILKTPNVSENKQSPFYLQNSPLFEPELIASFEQELCSEADLLVSTMSWKEEDEANKSSFLLSFEEKCPPGGEKSVVLYTTTIGLIRKTFEDCNSVRSILQSYNISFIERDISLDLRFREEFKMLMGGSKEAKPPVLFVKGRMVGGIDEVSRLAEERTMQILMEGIPMAVSCGECGGLRFLICQECNGSSKVLDEEEKKMKCWACNENGLVYCPSCNS